MLGLVQVESGFRKYAISIAGARGYMQVMPFWARLIGDGDSAALFHMQTNLRFGCVILRHYLDVERGDLYMALGRYNGSRGRPEYPNAVFGARRAWEFSAGLMQRGATGPAQALGAARLDAEQREHPLDRVVDHLVDRLSAGDRTPAAAGRRSPPISVTRRHVAQVGEVERRLAHHQDAGAGAPSAARRRRASAGCPRGRGRSPRATSSSTARPPSPAAANEPLAIAAPTSAGL